MEKKRAVCHHCLMKAIRRQKNICRYSWSMGRDVRAAGQGYDQAVNEPMITRSRLLRQIKRGR